MKPAFLVLIAVSSLISSFSHARCEHLNLVGSWGDSVQGWKISKNPNTGKLNILEVSDYVGEFAVHYIDTLEANLSFDPKTCVIEKSYTKQTNESFYNGHDITDMVRHDVIRFTLLQVESNSTGTELHYAMCVGRECNFLPNSDIQTIKSVDPKQASGGAASECATNYVKTRLGCMPQNKDSFRL